MQLQGPQSTASETSQHELSLSLSLLVTADARLPADTQRSWDNALGEVGSLGQAWDLPGVRTAGPEQGCQPQAVPLLGVGGKQAENY